MASGKSSCEDPSNTIVNVTEPVTSQMKVRELREKLEELGMDTKGSKRELVTRLTNAMKRKEDYGEDSDTEEDDSDDDDEVKRRPRQMSFKDVEDSIQTFSGDNTLTFLKDTENVTDKENNENALVSFPSTASNLLVDAYVVPTDEVEKFGNSTNLAEHICADKSVIVSNDSLMLHLFDTFSEDSFNIGAIDAASELHDDMDADIENIVLHDDWNIDTTRLRFTEIDRQSIVGFGHVFAELQRLSTHWINGIECRFAVETGTKRHGRKTQYFVECRMCRFRKSFWNKPIVDDILNVSEDAVCGTILTGTGHKQLEELLGTMDVPCMSNKTYLIYHSEMSETFTAIAEKEMREASEKKDN
ncbi:hypothetical protein KM043_016480 [Ampulex compressa]|nr:hypothetical protein KM043_016480 [Ampulex compressa]